MSTEKPSKAFAVRRWKHPTLDFTVILVLYNFEKDLEQTVQWAANTIGTPIPAGLWMTDNNINPEFRKGGPGLGAKCLYMTEQQFVTFTLAVGLPVERDK